MNEYLTYQQINLIPRHSNLDSRSNASTTINFFNREYIIPVVPANMRSVIDIPTARKLSEMGVFYIMHRHGSSIRGLPLSRELALTANRENWKTSSISIGVNDDSKSDLEWIKAQGFKIDFVTIDVAHGHHDKVLRMIYWIKENFPCILIAGNVATAEGKNFLIKAGTDAVKVGIGQGGICTTRYETGFGLPMFSTILDCARAETFIPASNNKIVLPNRKCPIIADGGIQRIGDIAKALVAGADMVMAGGLFASCEDSPAEIINGQKQYHGSTSFAIKGENKHIEGRTVQLAPSNTYESRIEEIKMALQSAISYAGGDDLTAFNNVKWVKVNNG